MKKSILMAFVALLFTAGACKKNNSDNDLERGGKQYVSKEPKPGEGYLMLTEKSLYDKVKLASGDEKGKAFELKKVSRDGNTLIVSVSYPTSCDGVSFDVIWDGNVMLSYPYKINLVLKMNAEDCGANQEKINKDLKINITDYIGNFAANNETVFSVINASTKKETNNDSTRNN